MSDRLRQSLTLFRDLLKSRVNPCELILFGSRARGEEASDSDADVLVVVEERTREIEDRISECAWKAGFPHDLLISPVVFSKCSPPDMGWDK